MDLNRGLESEARGPITCRKVLAEGAKRMSLLRSSRREEGPAEGWVLHCSHISGSGRKWKRQRSLRDVGKAGECNGQERQEPSEFSRVASIPRDGAWTQTWGLLARRLDRRSWATLSGKELVEWRLGAGDTPGHTFRNTVTYSLLGPSP